MVNQGIRMTKYDSSEYRKKNPTIGIIQLDTKFQRLIGDIGNPKTWKFPVLYQVMEELFPEKVIYQSDLSVLSIALKTAKKLEKKGVDGITTTCGFLAKYQKEITSHVNIPVFTSSLIQIPLIYKMLNYQKNIGVITASARSLTKEILLGVGIENIPLAIFGMEGKEYFQKVFINNQITYFNRVTVRDEIIDVAKNMVHSNYKIGAIVLECTNMSPYAYDIQIATGLPVFDMNSLMTWVYSGLIKNIFN